MTAGVSRSGSTETKKARRSLPSSPSVFSQPASLEQRGRADFRAMGEAEEDGAGVAAEGGLGDRRAFLVDQRERRAVRLAAIAGRDTS